MAIMGVATDITDGVTGTTVPAGTTVATLTGVLIVTGVKGVAAGAVRGLTLRYNGPGLSPVKSLATVPALSAQPSL
jgi:hypothetical protein